MQERSLITNQGVDVLILENEENAQIENEEFQNKDV